MKNPTKETSILLVDVEGATRRSLSLVLGQEKFQIMEADSVDAALNTLAASPIDLVLISCSANQCLGLEVLGRIRQTCPFCETIILAESYDAQFASEALQAGAFDCLHQQDSHKQLLLKLQKAGQCVNMKRELFSLRQDVAMTCGFDNVVGISKAITKLKDTVRRIAPTDIPILITGAVGTGKGLFARVIHYHSNRRHGPFIAVDCSPFDKSLLEAELFGSGENFAASDSPTTRGSLERADGGTLFLDGVDQLPLSLQSKLVSFLQDFRIHPHGSSTETKKVDFRLITASENDLSVHVANEKFRKDLFHRLSVVTLNLPLLVERPDDIEILTDHFVRKIVAESSKRQITLSRQAVDKLISYAWPGNVRELENTLRRAIAVARDERLDADDITFVTSDPHQETQAPISLAPGRTDGLLSESQRSTIERTLVDNNWNFTQTAQELGIGRTTLWRKVKKYHLKQEHVAK